MTNLRITTLHVEGFRGLNQPVEFDLSAPITLLFAPNGTGKTTVCEAAEWLLTAQVERLRDQTFDVNLLRSVFGDEPREPYVRGELTIGDRSCTMTRTPKGAWFDKEPRGRPERIGNILATLAPAAAAPDAHHKTAIALRQNWLRGTRFLSSEALAALVDTDEASVDRRKQVFADLFGIRHLLDAERACNKYVEELEVFERQLARQVRATEVEIQTLRSQIAADSPVQPSSDSIVNELGRAEAGLDIPQSATAGDPRFLAERIEAALVVHARRDRVRGIQQNALDKALATFARREVLGAELTKLNGDIESVAKEVGDVEVRAREKAEECIRLSEEKARFNTLRRQLNGTLAEVTARLEQFQQCLDATGLPAPATWAALQSAMPETGWSTDQIEARERELKAAIGIADEFATEVAALAPIQAAADRARAEVLSADQMTALEKEVTEAERLAASTRAQADALLQPIERIRDAGRALLDQVHPPDGTDCPLCGHDWPSADALRAAIEAASLRAPRLITLTSAAAESADVIAESARVRLRDAVGKQSQAQRLQRHLQTATASVEQKRRAFARLRLDPTDLSLRRATEDLIDRVKLALAMVELDRVVEAHSAVIDLRPLFGSNRSPRQGFNDVTAAITLRQAEVDATIAKTTSDEEQATGERDSLRTDYASKQQLLGALRNRKTEGETEIRTLTAGWSNAAPGLEWTQDNMRATQARLSDEAQKLATIDTLISAAKGALDRQERLIRLRGLENELKPLRARRRRMRARLTAGRKASSAFGEAYTRISSTQVKALSAVVNPLFARMHANRVVDAIGLGEAESFLRWFATAGEAQLDPKNNFSQGQKQDLALALFLARARSLGGTFFLDEPVAHLDDLNRVGLLDVIRVAVLERGADLNLVITTASRTLARHLVEKFANVDTVESAFGKLRPLRVIELTGNARTGVSKEHVYPSGAATTTSS